MDEYQPPPDRDDFLADVAEMYYLKGMRQAEIGKIIDLTPSMVSRMLTEARQRGIVKVTINRPVQSDYALEKQLVKAFGLQAAFVVAIRSYRSQYLSYLGAAGAQALKRFLEPNTILGVAWGTTLRALVDEVDAVQPLNIRLVELVGALGARSNEYEGHTIITRLADKLGGEPYILNAPLICPSIEAAEALLEDPIIKEPLTLASQAQVALLGAGSLVIPDATVYRFGYFTEDLIHELRQAGAIGNVCGLYYDLQGRETCTEFCERLITISKTNLFKIPVRFGIAGGPDKAEVLLGALRGSYFNVLVTDSLTAKKILQLASTV